MADNREPPPLFDEEEVDDEIGQRHVHDLDDDNEDLFASAVQSHDSIHSTTTTNGHQGPPLLSSDDLFSGGGIEIKLDDDEYDGNGGKGIGAGGGRDRPYENSTFMSATSSDEHAPAATTTVTTEMMGSGSVVGGSKGRVTNMEEVEDEVGDQFIEISITDPLKIGEGMSAFMAYKVCTKTNLTFFKNKQFHVIRRFSDFLGLHEKLVEKHSHLGRIVPPAPEKSVVGMTKIKMSKESDSSASLEFVEKRRHALERFLNRTAAHPVLRMDPDFREFLEMLEELPRATNTSALSSAGVLRLFNRMGDTVSKITFKMDESDPWFEEKQQQIENLDQQLRKLHNSIETLVHYRRELALSTGVFSKSAAMLSNCEEHTTLSRALSQLAEVEDKADQIHQQQANQDFYIFAELMKDYINLIGAIKDVFHQRVKVYQTWQHAQQMLMKKREQKAKLEMMTKTDKITQAREEVVEWEAKVERGHEEFENISKMIRKEIDRFEYNRIKDFKDTIVKYMESLMNNQQQELECVLEAKGWLNHLIKCWEAFLPEAKAIA